MDNYLLMGHILVCKIIPKDKIHPELWVGANRKWRKVPHDRLVRVKHNRVCTFEDGFVYLYLELDDSRNGPRKNRSVFGHVYYRDSIKNSRG